jgi:hypothetical protein
MYGFFGKNGLMGLQGAGKSVAGVGSNHVCVEKLNALGLSLRPMKMIPLMQNLMNDPGSIGFISHIGETHEKMCDELTFIIDNCGPELKRLTRVARAVAQAEAKDDKRKHMNAGSKTAFREALKEAIARKETNKPIKSDELLKTDSLAFWQTCHDFMTRKSQCYDDMVFLFNNHKLFANTKAFLHAEPVRDDRKRLFVGTEQAEHGDGVEDYEIIFQVSHDSVMCLGFAGESVYEISDFWLPTLIYGCEMVSIICSWDSSIMIPANVKDRTAKGGFSLGLGSVMQSINKCAVSIGSFIIVEERVDTISEGDPTSMEIRYGGYLRQFFALLPMDDKSAYDRSETDYGYSHMNVVDGEEGSFNPSMNVFAARYRTSPYSEVKPEYKDVVQSERSTQDVPRVSPNLNFGLAARINKFTKSLY